MTPPTAHGTLRDPDRAHPVLDIDLWKRKFPLMPHTKWFSSACIDSPKQLALIEQLHASMTPGTHSAQTDAFVWKSGYHGSRTPLTKIGGKPWMHPYTPWPSDPDGRPLQFIAQINFTDSKDLIPFDLPGDILLLFARWFDGYIDWDTEAMHIEWSNNDAIDTDTRREAPHGSTLAFCHEGVIHRTTQSWHTEDDPAFRMSEQSMQATLIGTHADIPQGWPFEGDDNCTLICMFSSYSFRGDWPLCDIERAPVPLRNDGTESSFPDYSALSTNYADAGAVWIYRDKHGDIKFEMAC